MPIDISKIGLIILKKEIQIYALEGQLQQSRQEIIQLQKELEKYQPKPEKDKHEEKKDVKN